MKGEDSAERGETPLVVFDMLKPPRNKTVHIFRTQTMPEISVMGPTRSYILQALKRTPSGLLLLQGGKGTLGKCRHLLLPWPTLLSVTNLWVNTRLRWSLLPRIVFFLCVCVCVLMHMIREKASHEAPLPHHCGAQGRKFTLTLPWLAKPLHTHSAGSD